MRRMLALVLSLAIAAPVGLLASDMNLQIVPLEEDVLQRERTERELRLKEAAAAKGGGMKWLYILGGAVLLGAAAGGGGGSEGGGGGAPTGSVTGTW